MTMLFSLLRRPILPVGKLPVAGSFNPYTYYWATDTDGARFDPSELIKSDATGNWQWAYFSDKSAARCFFVSMAEKDTRLVIFIEASRLLKKCTATLEAAL